METSLANITHLLTEVLAKTSVVSTSTDPRIFIESVSTVSIPRVDTPAIKSMDAMAGDVST